MMKRLVVQFLILSSAIGSLFMAGCASNTAAPVVDRSVGSSKPTVIASAPFPVTMPQNPADFYTVKKGDTLYSIALDHGRSYRDVAAWNNIENINVVKIGQQLRITPPDNGAVAVTTPVTSPVVISSVSSNAIPPAASESRPTGVNSETFKREPKGGKQPWVEPKPEAGKDAAKDATKDVTKDVTKDAGTATTKPTPPTETATTPDEPVWVWPSKGKLISGFVEGTSKGIDIDGKIGDPVFAAEAGKVTYASNSIRGYGNLLIIQHPGGMTSVYAHNSKLLAKEGQAVTKGQKVAEVGNTDTDQAKLHFEIRRQGKPLDPMKYLPAK